MGGMFIGVILPMLLIIIANKLQADYKAKREEKEYKAMIKRVALDVAKEMEKLKELPPSSKE